MRILMTVFLLVCMSSIAGAEVINLKDGRVVTGKVIEKTAQGVKVDVNGASATYFNDDIKDIDGVAIAVPVAAPAVVAPVVSAPVAAGTLAAPDTTVIAADKKALILKFIDAFGTRKALEQNFELMLSQMPADKPEEAKQLRERVKVGEIIEQLLPIYDHNFSAQELQGFIDFYQSPNGQKLLTTIPILMKESVEVSAKYLEGKFPEMVEKAPEKAPVDSAAK